MLGHKYITTRRDLPYVYVCVFVCMRVCSVCVCMCVYVCVCVCELMIMVYFMLDVSYEILWKLTLL